MCAAFIILMLSKWQVISNKCVSLGELEKNHSNNFQKKLLKHLTRGEQKASSQAT